MKGLGSSRKAARQGFSTALVHVLKNIEPDITTSKVFDLISEHLVVNASCKSQVCLHILFTRTVCVCHSFVFLISYKRFKSPVTVFLKAIIRINLFFALNY